MTFHRICLTTLAALPIWCRAEELLAPPAQLPAGVRYQISDTATAEAAANRLRSALVRGDIGSLLPLGDDGAKVLIGPYLSIEIDAGELKGRQFLNRGRYRLPVPEHPEGIVVEGFGANDDAQKRLLASYLTTAADFAGLRIRRATFDEIALIWAWIAWDLDDPLLIAEGANETYAFDFDAKSGRITWIERLTKPCFSGSVDGNSIPGCYCSGIRRSAQSWNLEFKKLEQCPAPLIEQVRQVAQSSTGPVAYVRTGERSGRIDSWLARRFRSSYALEIIPSELPGYSGPGKLLAGSPPEKVLVDGQPLRGYVLLASVISPEGTMQDSRVLISTDERLSTAALAASKGWRVEPPRRDGKPVAEIIWQELPF